MPDWYIMRCGWMDGFKPEPFTEREAFLWSIEQAAFQTQTRSLNGHLVSIARGEFVTSLRDMARAFGWSVKKVRGFVARMIASAKWAHRTAYEGAQSPSVIIVCDFDEFGAPDRGAIQ